MTLGERVKEVRKSLGLTQQGFAEKLGLKQNSIAQIEGGRNTSDQTIRMICREFCVNKEWLRTGEEPMFVPKEDDPLDELVKKRKLSEADRLLIEKFLNLKPADRKSVMDYVLSVADEYRQLDSEAAEEMEVKRKTPIPVSKDELEGSEESPNGEDITGQSPLDIPAELAELKRLNQEMAAEIAAMKEEDALFGLMGTSEASPSESAGNLSRSAKK